LPFALVREVTDSFVRCVTSRPADPPLDPQLARQQHQSYREALVGGGFEIVVVAGDEAHPDGCFIEDAAVVVGDAALIARSGHPSRRGEEGPVSAALAGIVEIERLGEGTLDGGDVLQVGGRVFVGVGRRTDLTGATTLADLSRRQGRVPVLVDAADALHLKSAVTALDDETLLWHRAAGAPETFAPLRVVDVGGDDPEAANVVRLADGRILCASAQERTIEAVTRAGHTAVTIDVSEFGRADGGLTCLSIRVR
jgi:dimethylargininase